MASKKDFSKKKLHFMIFLLPKKLEKSGIISAFFTITTAQDSGSTIDGREPGAP